ncbi:chorismate synthase, partial [Escherichia coli]
RVAAGAIANYYLNQNFGFEVKGYLSLLGRISCELVDWSIVETNPFFCPDPSRLDALDEYMRALKKEGNSIGAKVTV